MRLAVANEGGPEGRRRDKWAMEASAEIIRRWLRGVVRDEGHGVARRWGRRCVIRVDWRGAVRYLICCVVCIVHSSLEWREAGGKRSGHYPRGDLPGDPSDPKLER